MNAEFKELAAAGCPVIQVEEPRHHGLSTLPDCKDADLEFQTEAFNRQLVGVDAEIWVHCCWGNPNQQRVYWEVPSYERALPHLLQLNCDVITFECASSDGRDLPLFAKYPTDKKIGIGVVSHTNTVVEPPEHVANLIRKALEYIPPERLIVTTDCGFGREGLSRRIAYLQMRVTGRGHQHRAPRIGFARSAHPRRRPEALFRHRGRGVAAVLHRRLASFEMRPGCRRAAPQDDGG